MTYIQQKDLIEAARTLRSEGARVVPDSRVLPNPQNAVTDAASRDEGYDTLEVLPTDVASKDGDDGDDILRIFQDIWTVPGSWRNADGYTMLTLLMLRNVAVQWDWLGKYYLTKMAHDDCFGAGVYTHNWSKDGHMPLHFAVESDDYKYIEELKGLEDEPNFNGVTALYHAVDLGKEEIIKKLLSALRLIDKRRVVLSAILTNCKGKSALQLAKDKKLQNVVKTIEEYARAFHDCALVLQPTMHCCELNEFSIHQVQKTITDQRPDLFRYYVCHWPNDCLGWREEETGNTILQWMLRNRCNIYDIFRETFDSTPYYMAMILLDCAGQKKDFEGFINCTNIEMETAEHIAIKTKQYEYLDLFHSRGSNIYARDNKGNNALYCFLSTEDALRDGSNAPYLDSILCLDKYYLSNPTKIAGSSIAGSCIKPKDGDLIMTKGSDDKYALELVLAKYSNADDDTGVAKMLVQMWPEILTRLPEAKYKELWEAQRLTKRKLEKVLYKGMDPLWYSRVGEIFIRNQDKNFAVELLDHGVLPSLGLKNYTNSPLHWFVKDYNRYKTENPLLSFKDVDMNSTDFYGKNIIFYAIEYCNCELLELVINLDVSVRLEDIVHAVNKGWANVEAKLVNLLITGWLKKKISYGPCRHLDEALSPKRMTLTGISSFVFRIS
ncbi:hypothetical protein TSTA_110690 [Talaromyces stipitatus ATCC 10500]|uniref:Uncharacterized protein n=1 Tax=Talaromyces stipitatus (strain ATCC 10500 / CBS 375.48 / QM 6759 / NRRL 1006) TaxID=441959 RepID=B8MV00_TALSN|nr:uncharacterized protein TSTA_110690 [Talaromyces stipitatus ATCC 10500]EED11890.1 hypothetical protein TSTA_110690 [Talaromyces stipitatus ATCC 10500]